MTLQYLRAFQILRTLSILRAFQILRAFAQSEFIISELAFCRFSVKRWGTKFWTGFHFPGGTIPLSIGSLGIRPRVRLGPDR